MKKVLIAIAIVAVIAGGWWLLKDKETLTVEKVENVENGTPWYENDSLLLAQLDAAIKDAKEANPSEVSKNLMPVKKGTPGEEWANIDGKDMVLVVTLVDSSRLQRFFSGEDSVAAHMRMIQMYGLSPDCDYNIMVQFYADPSYMFRPAHDPDITTTSAGLEFPSYADEKFKVGETNFREWYRYSFASAYEDDSPLPWTQLGYTYDWHEGAPREGLSEYIVTHQSLIKVKSFESEWAFIQSEYHNRGMQNAPFVLFRV